MLDERLSAGSEDMNRIIRQAFCCCRDRKHRRRLERRQTEIEQTEIDLAAACISDHRNRQTTFFDVAGNSLERIQSNHRNPQRKAKAAGHRQSRSNSGKGSGTNRYPYAAELGKFDPCFFHDVANEWRDRVGMPFRHSKKSLGEHLFGNRVVNRGRTADHGCVEGQNNHGKRAKPQSAGQASIRPGEPRSLPE